MTGRHRARAVALLSLLALAGCLGGDDPSVHTENGHLSAVEVPEASPARAAPVTDAELDRAPELERVLERAAADENGSASRTVEPDRVDRVASVLAGKPSFGPDAPRFHRDGVYVSNGNATVLVRTSNVTGSIYATPVEVTARDVQVNDLGQAGRGNASALAALVEESVASDDVVDRPLNGGAGEAAAAELDGLEAYRPSYNDRRYWGKMIAYRDERFAVSRWQNDTAS